MTDDTETWCIIHRVPTRECRSLDHDVLHSCGYVEDTFACKIRHLHINAGKSRSGPRPWSADYAREAQQETGYNDIPEL